jgi:hypothetical protein
MQAVDNQVVLVVLLMEAAKVSLDLMQIMLLLVLPTQVLAVEELGIAAEVPQVEMAVLAL